MFYKVLINFCVLTAATDAMIGFVKPDGDPSDTWLELKTTGSLTRSGFMLLWLVTGCLRDVISLGTAVLWESQRRVL